MIYIVYSAAIWCTEKTETSNLQNTLLPNIFLHYNRVTIRVSRNMTALVEKLRDIEFFTRLPRFVCLTITNDKIGM